MSTRVSVTALEEPIKIVRNVPAHVGQAINRPVVALIPVNPPLFFVVDIAFTARDVLRPTRYETMITSTKLIGIICRPRWSVIYTIIVGIYPGSAQQTFMCADGTTAS